MVVDDISNNAEASATAKPRAKDKLVVVGDLAFCQSARDPNPLARVVKFIGDNDGCQIKEWHAD